MPRPVNKVRETTNEIYKMILEITAASKLGYGDLKELRDFLKNKITSSMVEDTMVLRKKKEQEEFMKSHLSYITKDDILSDISKENIESM